MKEEILASRYARALLNSAKDCNAIDKMDAQLKLFLDLLKKSPQLNLALSHPAISFEDKKSFLDEIFKQTEFLPEFKNFIYLLVRKKRFYLLRIIDEIFSQRVLFLEKRLPVSVYLPQSLSEANKKLLLKKLSEKFNKKIDLYLHIDPALIGGLKLEIGQKFFDASIKKNLELLVSQLQE
jgi:F-type H+-transporting ATPase subunit delta